MLLIMKIKILSVKLGSVAMGKNARDYNILGRLENDQEIEIFDFQPLDIRAYENKTLDCLIFAWMRKIRDNNKYLIKGKFIENFLIPSKWLECDSSLKGRSYPAVETAYGYFLIDPEEYDNSYLEAKDGDTIEFDGFRLDLVSYLLTD